MHLLAIISFAAFGIFSIGLAFYHERSWWKRQKWHQGRGIITGYQKARGTDGDTYPAVIEYRFSEETREFVSKYSSSRKPRIGTEVELRISPDGLEAEMYTTSIRFGISIAFGVAGLLCLLLAANVEPLENEESGGCGAVFEGEAREFSGEDGDTPVK